MYTISAIMEDRMIYRKNNILNCVQSTLPHLYLLLFYMHQIILLLIICLAIVHLLLPNLSLKSYLCKKISTTINALIKKKK